MRLIQEIWSYKLADFVQKNNDEEKVKVNCVLSYNKENLKEGNIIFTLESVMLKYL